MKVPDIKVTPPGPKAQEIVKRDQAFIATTTKTAPVVAARAEGSLVWDVDGNVLIDFATGISVLNIGHSHPKVVQAVSEQAKKFTHFAGTDYYYDIQTQLAEKLGKVTPGKHRKKAFFTNSGAEANEAALKIAKYNTKKQMFLAFLKAFHGRTQGALALTASKAKHRAGFFPTMPGVVHAPDGYCFRRPSHPPYPACDLYSANIIEALYRKTIVPPQDLAGIVLEPVQGEGGYIVPPKGWLTRISKIAKDSGALFIDDEVQTGFGRTGKFWMVDHENLVPDVITMAKAMGSGLPIGAAVFPAEMDFKEYGIHSNTYGGNPIASAASLATIDVIESERLVERSARLGVHLAKRLDELKDAYEFVGDRRGIGLMQAHEFVKDRRSLKPDPKIRDKITEDAYKHGLILLPCGDSSLRYIPALNVPEDILDAGVDVLADSFRHVAK